MAAFPKAKRPPMGSAGVLLSIAVNARLRAIILSGRGFDVAAVQTNVAEFVIVQLRELANGLAITTPSAEFLSEGFERGHAPLLTYFPIFASADPQWTLPLPSHCNMGARDRRR
jgi:hypothetical protein